jgi:hypothetical protein
MVDELSEKLDTLEKTFGPEYVALIDGLPDIDPENDKLGCGDYVDTRSTRQAVHEVGLENPTD